jgi:hypothetical protein
LIIAVCLHALGAFTTEVSSDFPWERQGGDIRSVGRKACNPAERIWTILMDEVSEKYVASRLQNALRALLAMLRRRCLSVHDNCIIIVESFPPRET